MPSDQVNTPTYNRDLAAATKMLLESGASGLYNIGGSEALTLVRVRDRVRLGLGLA